MRRLAGRACASHRERAGRTRRQSPRRLASSEKTSLLSSGTKWGFGCALLPVPAAAVALAEPSMGVASRYGRPLGLRRTKLFFRLWASAQSAWGRNRGRCRGENEPRRSFLAVQTLFDTIHSIEPVTSLRAVSCRTAELAHLYTKLCQIAAPMTSSGTPRALPLVSGRPRWRETV